MSSTLPGDPNSPVYGPPAPKGKQQGPTIKFTAQPPKSTGLSEKKAFLDFIHAHPIMLPYSNDIWNQAHNYKVDAAVMAALFWRESFAEAKRQGVDPATIESYAGAVGIGQMHRGTWLGQTDPWGEKITDAYMRDPKKNIRWATYYFAQQLSKFSTPDEAYNKGYNPGYAGPSLLSVLPANYVPTGGGVSGAQHAQDLANQGTLNATVKAGSPGYNAAKAKAALAAEAAKKQLTDPWVVLDDKGHIQYAYQETPPKGVLKSGPIPLTYTQFLSNWRAFADVFRAYTGREATGREQKAILSGTSKYGLTPYSVSVYLSQQPEYIGSPNWKQAGADTQAYIKAKLGRNVAPKMVGRIVAENWGQNELNQWITKQPGYMQGPEYKNKYATLSNTFESIMGKADARGQAYIHDAIVNGWNEDALANALRHDPSYKYSPEYEARAVGFLDSLGMFIGARPVLKPTTPVGAPPSSTNIAAQIKKPNATLRAALPYEATYKVPAATQPPKPKTVKAPTRKKPLL